MGASTRDPLNPIQAQGVGNHGKMSAFHGLPSVGTTFCRTLPEQTATVTATVAAKGTRLVSEATTMHVRYDAAGRTFQDAQHEDHPRSAGSGTLNPIARVSFCSALGPPSLV